MRFIAVILLCGFSLAGCLVIPTSVKTPLPHDKIDNLQLHNSSRESVLQVMGKPEVSRDGGRVWLYSSGHLVAIMLAISNTGGGANVYAHEWLFLRFDNDGKLVEKELVGEKHGCTQSGYCLQGGWYREKGQYHLMDSMTVLSQSTTAQDVPPVREGECRLYLYYVGQENRLLPRYKTSIMINHAGPYTSDEHTYVRLDIPAGRFTVSLPKAQKHRVMSEINTFDCPAGQQRYYGISLTIDDEIFKKVFRPDYLQMFTVAPTVAIKTLRQRRMTVNP